MLKLDPILAQGAGIAIEDAYHLVKGLERMHANGMNPTCLMSADEWKAYDDHR